MNFRNYKRYLKLRYKLEDIALFPIRCIYTLTYHLSKKYRKKYPKKYSEKQILKTIRYCIDCHLDYNDCIYILLKSRINNIDGKDYGGFGYGDLGQIPYNRKIKRRLLTIEHEQKENYIAAIQKTCEMIGTLIPDDQKEQEFSYTLMGDDSFRFKNLLFYESQDCKVYKIVKNEK